MIIHCGRKHLCRHCLQVFSSDEILKCHSNSDSEDCFKINGKQRIKMPTKGEYIKLKNCERTIKTPFMIYAIFESTLVPEDMERKILKNLIQISKICSLQLWL